ncbi:hypothetical protein [Cysteiniphilum halobium]|uniref:hypothetical protein n=1 Tax=Cysteiniphilum halobium TaxID=2219059 RepID=UPI000E656E5E|nr:hypothetical protein [Cysteiniphilum halobium]
MKITKLIPVIISSMLLFGCNSDDGNKKSAVTTTATLVPSQTHVNIETSHSLQITVTNAGNKQANDFDVELQAGDGVSIDKTASNIPSQLAPGASAVIVLTASASAVVGSKAVLTIRSSDSINQLSIPVDVIAEPPEVVKLALSTDSSVLGSGGIKHYVLTNNSAQDVPELTGADKGVSGLSVAAYQSGTSIAATGASIINNTCSGVILKPSENCTFDVKAADMASNQAIDIKVAVNSQTEVSKSLQILRPVLSINPEDALSGFKSQMTKAQSQFLSLDSQHITIVPGMHKTIQISNSSVVPATDVQFSIPALSGVTQDPASTCVNGMTLNGGDSCSIIIDGSLENYPSGSGELQISANNADQVNQLMLGSSSSSQLQMSDSYHLLISSGESIEIPLKARNNSSLSLDHLAMSILPNDGSLVASTNNNCGITLLGQSYCNNSYTYTAPNVMTNEEKLYSLAYGDTKSNGNNSAGIMLGVDIFPKFIDLKLANNAYIASNTQGSFYLKNGVVYAATFDGLSISSNGGKSWHTYGKDKLGVRMINSTYVDANTIYVGTNGAGLAISNDNGVTWRNIKTVDGIINDYVNSVYVSGKEIILGTDGGISISNDGGGTWNNIDQSTGLGGNKIGSIYVDSSTIYAGDYNNGGLSISDDNGATWQVIKKAANGLVDNAVESISKHNDKIYVGTDNGLSITSDGGKTWDNKAIGKEFNAGYSYASGFCFLDNKIYAPIHDPSDTTWHGGLEFSIDGGETWQRVSAIETMNIRALTCDKSSIYVGDGNTGGMWVSHDKGATFERQYNPLEAVHKFFSANHKLYGLTSFGQTSGWAISDDNGASWATYIAPHGQGSSLPFNMQINDMYVNGAYMYIASPVGIYISNDSGSSWQRVNDSKLHGWIAAIAGTDDGKYLYAVTDDYGNDGVYISSDHGVTWARTYNGIMDGYAKIYVTDDKFYTWTQQGGGFTGALLVFNEDGSYDKQLLTGKAIESVYLKNNKLYVGTRKNGLYVTTDGGANWSNMTSGVTELDGYSIQAIYLSGSAIYIGLNSISAPSPTYGVAVSYDNGATWQRYFEYNSCNSIATSNNGNIFITCSFGSHAVGEILISN